MYFEILFALLFVLKFHRGLCFENETLGEVFNTTFDPYSVFMELNKEWEQFPYQNYSDLQDMIYIFKNVTFAQNNDFEILVKKLQALRNKTADSIGDGLSWLGNQTTRFLKNDTTVSLYPVITDVIRSSDVSFDAPTIKFEVTVEFGLRGIEIDPVLPLYLLQNATLYQEFNCSVLDFTLFHYAKTTEDKYGWVSIKTNGTRKCYYSIGKNSTKINIYHVLHLDVECVKDFSSFPFDELKCDTHLLTRNQSDSVIQGQKKIWRYQVEKAELRKCKIPDYYLVNLNVTAEGYPGGYWFDIKMEMVFYRKHGFYLYTMYVPIALLVFVAWLSFFIGTSYVDVQIRLGLVVTILLTLVTVIQGVNSNVPKSPQLKAVDIWCTVSVTLVIGVLVEIVTVRILLWMRPVDKKETLDTKELILQLVTVIKAANHVDENGKEHENEKSAPEVRKANATTGKGKQKWVWLARGVDAFAAMLYLLIFGVCIAYHVNKYCSFDRLLDQRYFESISHYD